MLNLNIDDEVYVIRKFGTYRDGFDVQIIKYKVQYKGTSKFIPYGFKDMLEKYQEISYSECYKTLDEAEKIVKSAFGDSVEFIDKYNGNYYDVKFN